MSRASQRGVRAGAMLSEVNDASAALLAAAAGLDFLIVDTEHGRFTQPQVGAIAMLARNEGVDCIVRVAAPTRETILPALDAGAAGVMVPAIDDADEARQAASWAKYPPLGARGVVGRRPHTRYGSPDLETMMRAHNEATQVWIQVETASALSGVRDIAEVPGVDVLFVGPTDLSVSRGRAGQLWSADAVADYRRVADEARRAGLGSAIQLGSEADWPRVADLGLTHCSIGSDVGALVDTWARGAAAVRGDGTG